jgi:hypothetical protein
MLEADFDQILREHPPLICPAGIFSPEGRRAADQTSWLSVYGSSERKRARLIAVAS